MATHEPLLVNQVNQKAGEQNTPLNAFIGGVKGLLGDAISVSLDTGTRVGAAHATTGIPYAISGTASLIQANVSAKLATFKDPIKAILGTGIHNEQRIIIKRKYVAGGSATVVPEHASARTVAIREDVREVMLTRYGNDIEMNLNLFLRPEDAKEELQMKLEASQIALEKAFIRLGYEAVFDNGVDLSLAIARSRNMLGQSDISNIYCRQLFGIFAKSAYPITTIMAAAKYASAYAVATATKTVMIVPFGTPEYIKYTKPHHMEYELSGISEQARGGIDLTIPGGYRDPLSNCTIYQHIPPVDMAAGVPHPTVEDSLLSKQTTVVSRIKLPADGAECKVLNYKTGDWAIVPNWHASENASNEIQIVYNGTVYTGQAPCEGAWAQICGGVAEEWENGAGANDIATNIAMVNARRPTHYIRRSRFKMLSAILAAPGKATGELLYAYSSCSVSTNPATELGKLGLRVYLGAAIYAPENIFILPNVAFETVLSDNLFAVRCDNGILDNTLPHHSEGFSDDGNSAFSKFDTAHGAQWEIADHVNDNIKVHVDVFPLHENAPARNVSIYNEGGAFVLDGTNNKNVLLKMMGDDDDDTYTAHTNIYSCATFDKDGKILTKNTGQLNDLDTPEKIGRLSGLIEFNERAT